jgi:hypothetical protein
MGVVELTGNVSATAMAPDREGPLRGILAATDAHLSRMVARTAEEAHKLLELDPPKKRELLRYKRSVRLLSGIYRTRATDLELVLAVSAVPLVDSILSLLRSEKNPALLKTDRAFEKRLIFLMHQTAAKYNLTGQVAEEYGMLAARVSNRIAKYPKYSAYGLRFMLPILVDHLIAEVQLSIDSGFKTPELNLINSSVFQIQEKLAELSRHPNEIVRHNALAIHNVALDDGKMEAADTIVKELLGDNDRRRERQLVRLRGTLRHKGYAKKESRTSL